ncbi:hypothetical protein Dda_7363 [Drechslerella dactyloides]|uniref:GATA-type domain-containing protein n=1 Tax=Drechslerella dactyloides TaxID=74499 RepID=A0AAD6IS86_DREDA|nr:hypothetical protein Dda_7363 [Drechslerella dactyloides]
MGDILTKYQRTTCYATHSRNLESIMKEIPERTALSAIGTETKRLFQAITEVADENPELDESLKTQLAAEADRFGLWAVNLGLFVSGHGSLDYRVREADNVKSTLYRFMISLNESLHDVLEYCSESNSGASAEDALDDSAIDLATDVDDSFENGWDDESETDAEIDIDSLLAGIRDPIDRLYKLSSWIRNPSYRVPSAKMLAYRQIDPETGKDLLEVAEGFDLDHIRSIFLDYRRAKTQSESPDCCPRTVDAEAPFLSTDERVLREAQLLDGYEYLIHRLARANLRRRQQFAYWKRHREKLLKHAEAAAELHAHAHAQQYQRCAGEKSTPYTIALKEELANTGPMTLSVTTATRLNLTRQLPILDDKSTVSVSVYAPSNWKPGNEMLGFPPPPKNPNNEKFIDCHCCFTTCPKAVTQVNAWRAHLIHDLRPYICTYKDCKTPEQLYDSREEWIQHENSVHRRVFRCPEHPTQTFYSAAEYEEHTQDGHLGSIPLAVIMQAGESSLDVPDRPCPVCLLTADNMSSQQKHIALHLERFSLFSLPRDGGPEEDEEGDGSDGKIKNNDATSYQAYTDGGGSRDDNWSGGALGDNLDNFWTAGINEPGDIAVPSSDVGYEDPDPQTDKKAFAESLDRVARYFKESDNKGPQRSENEKTVPETAGMKGAMDTYSGAGTVILDADLEQLLKEQSLICSNCSTSATSLWRWGPQGSLLCNPCGQFFMDRDSMRPPPVDTLLEPTVLEATPDGRWEEVSNEQARTCSNCSTQSTPVWRHDPEGRPLCNSCGLFFSLYGVMRNPSEIANNKIFKQSEDEETVPETTRTKRTTTPVGDLLESSNMEPTFNDRSNWLPDEPASACSNCSAHITPRWKRYPGDLALCSSCTLASKLPGIGPIRSKPDVVRQRNRSHVRPQPREPTSADDLALAPVENAEESAKGIVPSDSSDISLPPSPVLGPEAALPTGLKPGPFACPTCGATFAFETNRTRHVDSRACEGNAAASEFPCPIDGCPIAIKQGKGKLSVHLRKIHGLKMKLAEAKSKDKVVQDVTYTFCNIDGCTAMVMHDPDRENMRTHLRVTHGIGVESDGEGDNSKDKQDTGEIKEDSLLDVDEEATSDDNGSDRHVESDRVSVDIETGSQGIDKRFGPVKRLIEEERRQERLNGDGKEKRVERPLEKKEQLRRWMAMEMNQQERLLKESLVKESLVKESPQLEEELQHQQKYALGDSDQKPDATSESPHKSKKTDPEIERMLAGTGSQFPSTGGQSGGGSPGDGDGLVQVEDLIAQLDTIMDGYSRESAPSNTSHSENLPVESDGKLQEAPANSNTSRKSELLRLIKRLIDSTTTVLFKLREYIDNNPGVDMDVLHLLNPLSDLLRGLRKVWDTIISFEDQIGGVAVGPPQTLSSLQEFLATVEYLGERIGLPGGLTRRYNSVSCPAPKHLGNQKLTTISYDLERHKSLLQNIFVGPEPVYYLTADQ